MFEANELAFLAQILDNAQVKGIQANVMMVQLFQKVQNAARELEAKSQGEENGEEGA